jgi:hypothetical protein
VIRPSAPAKQPICLPREPKEWTVLYCQDGNNNLEPEIVKNLLEMESVGSSRDVNIVSQLSRAPGKAIYGGKSHKKTRIDGDWVGSRRYLIEKNRHSVSDRRIHSTVLTSSAISPNHGDPKTLSDFIAWGVKNFPAKHYMVVISDHGEGFRGTGFDKFHHDHLTLPELSQAFETARRETGVKPDIITFDTCLMAHSETAFQLRNSANFMVGSEELVGCEGLPNINLLKHLTRHPETSAREFANKLVELSRDDATLRAKEGREEAAPQMSAIDLAKMEPLAACFKDLTKALKASRIKPETIHSLLRATKHFAPGEKVLADFRDVVDFCHKLGESPETNDRVRAAAAKLEDAVKDSCMSQHNVGRTMERAQGLSVYLPHQLRFKEQKYDATDFDKATGWSSWIESKFAT